MWYLIVSIPDLCNLITFILDLSYPKSQSVNEGICKDEYLGDKLDLVFPKVDDFVELIKSKGKGCLIFKKVLHRAYR